MAKKRVLFLIQDLSHGGAEKVLVNLVNHMDKTRFDVTVQTVFDTGVNRQYLREDVRYIPGLKWQFPGNSRLIQFLPAKPLYKFFVQEHYDTVVAFLEGTATKIISGCDEEGTEKIIWVHSTLKEYSICFQSYTAAVEAYKKMDHVICVAENVKECFETAAGMTFPQCQVLYNTNETDLILEKAKEPIEAGTFSEMEINLISAGKLTNVKGYDRLIPLIKSLRDEGYPVHLYLLGIGEKQKELQQLAEEHSVAAYVTFLGYQDNPYKYVAKADIYVCSSRREGFSTAVTEALVVGTPVVSTDCSGAYEMLGRNNEYGVVTENTADGLYQGLKYMLEDQRYRDYAPKAAERGKEFSTEKTVRAVERMLLGGD